MTPKQILLVLAAVLTSVAGGYTAANLTEPVIMAPVCPVCEVCAPVAVEPAAAAPVEPVVEPVPVAG